ncbi:MAG TPA: diadenylate cyclase CdaA, partial [Gemmatimonadales bacterium]|nr:diadenylate cyclase CdaA [Gemmatimonadales bacterium]
MPVSQIHFLAPTWRDALEVALVAFIIYRLLRVLAGTRALQIVFGVLVLLVAYVAAFLLKLTMITYLLGVLFTYGAFAVIVVFQPELRQALARLGQTRFLRAFTASNVDRVTEAVAEAVERLARNATGAIIVLEKDAALDEYVRTGTGIDAAVSADLLATIFTPYSPLHDGAVLIRGDRIIGAGCILPLTQFPVADRALGTRHRAALGLSEETDALVLVVSEENASVSLACEGRLARSLTFEQVRAVLDGPWPPDLRQFDP